MPTKAASSNTTTTKATAAKKAAVPVKKAAPRITKWNHPLADLVPKKERHDAYIPRAFEGFTDIAWMQYSDANDINVLLHGPTGPGKSHCIEAYAAVATWETDPERVGKPLVSIPCNSSIDTATLFGKYVMVAGEWVYVESALVQAVRHGGVVHFVEVDQMRKEVSSVFHNLTDSNRTLIVVENGGEHIVAHPDLMIVGSYNQAYGHRPMDPAFKDRFEVELLFDYDEELEKQIICPVDGGSIDNLLQLVKALRAMYREGAIETPVSTRMVNRFLWMALDFNYKAAVLNFVNKFTDDDKQSVRDALEIRSVGIQNEISEINTLLDQLEGA